MPSQVFCEHCGGLISSATSVPSLAKRCTCTEQSAETVAVKVCVECGKDVSHERRMRDAEGKYWCIACGEADHAQRHPEMGNCADCGMRWPVDKIKAWDDSVRLCEACYQGRATARENLERSYVQASRRWWTYPVGIGLGAAALLGAVVWLVK